MNKRCIVNVATGDFYLKMQERLVESLRPQVKKITEFGKDNFEGIDIWNTEGKFDIMVWVDVLPEKSRTHSESPYGFKVHAIKAAYEKGYTSILWLDSPAYAVKEDISPIFDKIEKEGYYAMSHVDPLENWVGQSALNVHGYKREDLVGLNLPSGSCYGFDLNGYGFYIFKSLMDAERTGFFRSEKIKEDSWHRHDEAILALLLKIYNHPVFTFDPLFQSDSPECVIKSGGE